MDTPKLHATLECFSVEESGYHFLPIIQGYINDTYLVLGNDRPRYILQRINHLVFKDIKGLMGNIQMALELLNDRDYERIELVKTVDGDTYCEVPGEGYWRLMSYVDQSVAYDITTDRNVAFQAGRILGKFHQLLQNAPVHKFSDTIPRFHDLGLRKEQLESALIQASPDKLVVASKAIAFAKETFSKLRELQQTQLPVRVCHNDTKLNNILFSKKSHKSLCFIDLDTLMKGYFYYDFGDAVRTVANTALEDERDLDKIGFDKVLFKNFVSGLHQSGLSLSADELNLLPLGAVFMPFIHGLRALTDYLNNNIYYKVFYETQNLDRCLSLFDFADKALAEVAYMESVIDKCFLR
ncbi:aminoglycoside phosphotransferase family protein [Flavobacteriaceae bacterium F89]|uniref:Aminoglycoside phosphotransferase family protein n=1 Tax=Cerina litoralis TaxID=2874477 RepID=A0AAE3ES66_9FLAO|nr:aminoglycoside phosphotransferase family protein [Cerina litoralis]MCG2460242.1 aminoglycoside phosphotransferase family protein [Cerina litoralis]